VITFLEDLQSPMTLESALRYLRCCICGKVQKLTFDQLAVVLENNREKMYCCKQCEERGCSPERKPDS
tara:strand:- start:425 stop:628 length:204 start_codon:yes stop_codon:yes gene_type:complete